MKKTLSEIKKDLDADLGKLVALKLFNRDELAERLGISRPNLISAFKGRRLLPHKYFAQLIDILGLTHKVKFNKEIIHTLTITNTSKQYYSLYDVLYVLGNTPFTQVAIFKVIGEKNNGYAYILKDSKNAYIVVRDDEKTLAYYDEENYFPHADKDFRKYFKIEDYLIHKEIEAEYFEKIMMNKVSIDELQNFLKKENKKVWTWGMLQKQADIKGFNASVVAKMLGFDE